jgi:hypothetical protein
MTASSKLILIKLAHTAIWIFFNVVIFYLAYAVISNNITGWTWISVGIILLEGIVLLIFKKICPVTLLARRFSNSTKDNFDIFLPNWLAKNNKLIYTIIFFIILILLGYRLAQ